ncbi:hypothetical protein AKO1_015612 [Acrasis kona]|uniref:Uncharacterized protein n=1 Tax=Acrasis kona TaxID=1008807 RepID=A0AAW2ZIG5_9EUKA
MLHRVFLLWTIMALILFMSTTQAKTNSLANRVQLSGQEGRAIIFYPKPPSGPSPTEGDD